MLFVDLATEKPKTKAQLIEENKHTSLPSAWTDATLEALNVARVTAVSAPEVGEFQIAVKDGVEQVDGEWRDKWVTEEMFSEYTDEEGNVVTVDDQKAQYTTQKNDDLADQARTKRNGLLAETDFYALSDVTMSAEMTTYRQALRDVPEQTDFPGTINWPTKPE